MSSRDVALLDRMIAGDADAAEAPAELVALATLARTLGDGAARPRAEFRDTLRTTLLADARALAARRPWWERTTDAAGRRLERWRYNARVAVASATAASLLSGGAVAAATERAIPGDVFYGLKGTVEDVLVALAGSEAGRGAALVGRLGERFEEVERALAMGDQDAAAASLRAADEEVRAGAQAVIVAYLDTADTALLTALDDRVRDGSARLAAVRPQLRGPAQAAAADLQTALDRIAARVQVLVTGSCTGCGDGVHDDPGAATTTANGVEADGTPPLPAASTDITFIPPADQPFRACPCVPGSLPVPAAGPTSAPGTPAVEPSGPDPATDEAPAAPADPSGGSDPPAAEPSGGPTYNPIPAPVDEALPPAVSEPAGDVIEELPPVNVPGPDLDELPPPPPTGPPDLDPPDVS